MISRNFLLLFVALFGAQLVYAPGNPIETDWRNKFTYKTERNNGVVHSYNYDTDLYFLENEPVQYGFNQSQKRYFVTGHSKTNVVPSQEAIKAVYDVREAQFNS